MSVVNISKRLVPRPWASGVLSKNEHVFGKIEGTRELPENSRGI